MKAWILHGINDLRFEEADAPIIGENEVLLAVRAAGICGSDIPRVFYTGTYSYPLIPGHEFAGQVEAVGAAVDGKWQGKRVGVFPLIPCGACLPCQKEQYEMCRHYSYLGSRRDGGFAEYVAVPEKNLIALPESVSFEEAAMFEPMSVAVHAMRKAAPQPEECTVVCGLGTIGLFLLMWRLLETAEDLAREGRCVVMSTHSPEHLFSPGCKVLLMREGRAAAFGSPEEVVTAGNLEAVYGVEMDVLAVEDRYGVKRRVCLPVRRGRP